MGAAILALVLVGGCGGGGGGAVGGTPAPAPTPTPSPTPTPTATPSSAFVTSEYNRSSGPSLHNAIAAWQNGTNGTGVTIAIIDSGIDTDSPEFAGRISSASADVAGNRGLDNAESDHGTNVALVAAAARDNTGVLGIAWNATIAMFRADTSGTCATADPAKVDSGCTFNDNNIAIGIDRAIAAGARVINLSLGGSPPNTALRNAVSRAAAAGIVVVIAAGNDGDSTDVAIDPNNPDLLASGLRQIGGGNVIIAGSVNKDGVFSAFSNRAGTEAAWFLSALGERVCCVYDNGVLKIVTNPDGSRSQFVFSGTSFSAPQIAGAVALLRQAFPNLTGTQVVDLLLRTARDAGAAGTDSTYGRGILDIAAAFAPQGAAKLANTAVAIPLSDTTVVTSAPMGDAGQGATLGAVILDSYDRAYGINLAAGLRSAHVNPRLANALAGETRQVALGNRQVSLAFSVDAQGRTARLPWSGPLRLSRSDADIARVLAARIIAQTAPGTQLGFAYAQGADGLVAQLQGRSQPAFLVSGSPLDDLGFAQSNQTSLALRRTLGRWGVTLSAQNGTALSAAPVNQADTIGARRQQDRAMRVGLSLDRRFGAVDTALGASWLSEDRTVLGARLHQALGSSGADTLFLDASAGWNVAPEWRLGAAWRSGFSTARSGGTVAAGSRLFTSAWALDASRLGVLKPGDSLSFRISQPLRVESGGLRFTLPVDYSYTTQTATQGLRILSLAPRGRELASELTWRGPLWNGAAMASVFYRKDPGHYANLPDDKGIALSWNRQF